MTRMFLSFVTAAMLHVSADAATLQGATLRAFERYVALTEARIEAELDPHPDVQREHGRGPGRVPVEAAGNRRDPGFLVTDRLPRAEADDALRRLRSGEIYKRRLETREADGTTVTIPNGMVHHWVGSVFVPGAHVDDLVVWIQKYDEHARYFDDVEASRLVRRDGDAYEIFLRLRRTKVLTVHYNTEHDVVYRRHGPGRVSSRSRGTRIAEVVDAGTPSERERAPGRDRGFLWRLSSYWRFEDLGDGVVVECETVSLSRGIPSAFRWLIGRYLDSVPKESLDATLGPIRERFGYGEGDAEGDKSTLVQSSSLRSKIS